MFRRGLSLVIGLVSLMGALVACSGDRLSNEELFGVIVDGADGMQTVNLGHYLYFAGRAEKGSGIGDVIEADLELFERYGVYDKDIFRMVVRWKKTAIRTAPGYALINEMRIVTGRFNFDKIRDRLYYEDYIDDEYRGYEIWQESSESGNAASLVPKYGLVVDGPLQEVKDFLRRLDRGAETSESVLKEIDGEFGDAWFTERDDSCESFGWLIHRSQKFRGCVASGWGILNSNHEIKVVGMFEDETSAREEAEAFEEVFLNLNRDEFVSSRRNGRFLEVVLERTPNEVDE